MHVSNSLRRHACALLLGGLAAFAAQAVVQWREAGGTLHDLMCTATHFVARAVAHAVGRHLAEAPIDRVLLSGGGTRNVLLWGLLARHWA